MVPLGFEHQFLELLLGPEAGHGSRVAILATHDDLLGETLFLAKPEVEGDANPLLGELARDAEGTPHKGATAGVELLHGTGFKGGAEEGQGPRFQGFEALGRGVGREVQVLAPGIFGEKSQPVVLGREGRVDGQQRAGRGLGGRGAESVDAIAKEQGLITAEAAEIQRAKGGAAVQGRTL